MGSVDGHSWAAGHGHEFTVPFGFFLHLLGVPPRAIIGSHYGVCAPMGAGRQTNNKIIIEGPYSPHRKYVPFTQKEVLSEDA